MTFDEPLLRAFVDGELDPASRAQVEHALLHSPELQVQVAALQASCLPYQAAFDAQALPELPAALSRRVSELSAVANAAPLRPARRQHLMGMGLAAAASFAAGALLPWRALTSGPAPSDTVSAMPWVPAIASYQALYVRETLDQLGDPPARLQTLLSGFSEAQRARLFVPDLASEGLTFKRVQRLGFAGQPLIQMVYLPQRGGPAALCLLPASGPDTAVRTQSLQGQGVASWTQQGLAYVLVADLSLDATQRLATRLQAGKFGSA